MAAGKLGNTAQIYARKGWPVFPLHALDEHGICTCGGPEVNPKCKPGKHPRTRNGHLNATTDPAQIDAWWSRWPDANIGIPTGKRSGFWVLDYDNLASLKTLEAEHGPHPATRTHSTGNGGIHYLYRYPAGAEIRNSTGKLAPGLDVRGEGGYIVAPPSRTTRPYQVVGDLPLADPPEWLLDALKKPQSAPSDDARARTGDFHRWEVSGPPIYEGKRNTTLTSIAGSLHDGTRSLADLTAELLAINAARCTPPLPDAEVIGIARSIHRRPPCKMAPDVAPATLALVTRLEELAKSRPKRGMGGHSNWAVYRALLETAKRVGREHPCGVEVSVAVRPLALAAGVGLGTVSRALDRLEARGLVRRSHSGGGERSGALVLIGAVVEHSSRPTLSESECSTLPPIGDLYRLRWGPGRIGKSRAAILEAVGECPGVTRAELARRLGRKPDSLKKPHRWLLDAGLLVRTARGCYALTPDFAERLAEWRETGGELTAEQRDRARYAREREAYTKHRKAEPGRAEPEVQASPEPPPAADGEISELMREVETAFHHVNGGVKCKHRVSASWCFECRWRTAAEEAAMVVEGAA